MKLLQGKIEKVPKKIAQQLIRGRNAKKWKQKELAANMSLPVKIFKTLRAVKQNIINSSYEKWQENQGLNREKQDK